MRVLVTGGAGYIGSHTALDLLLAGHEVAVIDNLCTGHAEALRRVEALAGRSVPLLRVDLRDAAALSAAVGSWPADACVHFAALKAVGDSVSQPLDYYENNVGGMVNLLRALDAAGVRDLVFSSSAAVYGPPAALPLTEAAPAAPASPYGRTKRVCEQILEDLAAADPRWRITALRYFNPIGAHASGWIGEDPGALPTNLLPYVARVADGRLPELVVHGDDYDTPDGTGVRDYVHVVDLARGHLAALDRLVTGCATYNLGTGRGTSVLEVVRAFERASGRAVPLRVGPRRPGDVAACWADPSRAEAALGWRAELDLDAMCADHWRWQRNNPGGYPAA